ncbi:efflux RND transporter permease subunit [Actibacterium sp. 188UL27-1]|uniref:efflux RND transporter permease subunit n=1 Tax=Actibacterium sp. 188UL27-1 TaxID=2786961 RepID=UPI00351BF056
MTAASPLEHAIIQASTYRLRPVMLATATTILGMLPLLGDAFFMSMAVTTMAGFAFATVLTLIAMSVLYRLMFRVAENTHQFEPALSSGNDASTYLEEAT